MSSSLLILSTADLPRFMVLKHQRNKKYLIHKHEDGDEFRGYLQFSGKDPMSPHAKYEVEPSSTAGNGLVHIKCCYNNKYWVCRENDYWVTAEAHQKEEDQSKWTCTLFKPEFFTSNRIGLYHVHLKENVTFADPRPFNLYVGVISPNGDYLDFIDWETLPILPKHIAIKGDNGLYLSASDSHNGHQWLRFDSQDIGDEKVGNEVVLFITPDEDQGSKIRLRSHYTDKFWRLSPNGSNEIWPDSDDTTSNNNKDTLFKVSKVGDKKIALQSMGNGKFCKRLTIEGKADCIIANDDYDISREAYLQVEDLVLKREIYNVHFDVKDARIYDAKIIIMATATLSNWQQTPNKATLELNYTIEHSQTWTTSTSLNKLDVETKVTAGIPIVEEGEAKISAEVTSSYLWGETKSESTKFKVNHEVDLPPMTTTTMTLLGTKASCDVPYSCTLHDVLTTGKEVIYTLDDGLYTSINTFNIQWNTTNVEDLSE